MRVCVNEVCCIYNVMQCRCSPLTKYMWAVVDVISFSLWAVSLLRTFHCLFGGKQDHLLISGCGVPTPWVSASLPCARQHPSYGDCLEVKTEYYPIKTAPCWVVWHSVHSQQHTHVSSSYRSSRLGLSHWDPYAMHRGGCLELYYCNMVEWFRWDSSLIWKTNWLPSVLRHCWFGHITCKNRPWYDL